jgi:Flp pilus assembly protein TadD
LRLRPGFAEAHYNWGNALLQEGRLSEARRQYEEALRLKPSFTEAHDQLTTMEPVQ